MFTSLHVSLSRLGVDTIAYGDIFNTLTDIQKRINQLST